MSDSKQKHRFRKQVIRYTVIAGVLAAAAWFGWSFANRRAAEILAPCIQDFIEDEDYENLEFLVSWRPEAVATTAYPQKDLFHHTHNGTQPLGAKSYMFTVPQLHLEPRRKEK